MRLRSRDSETWICLKTILKSSGLKVEKNIQNNVEHGFNSCLREGKGNEKSIPMHMADLIDFVTTAYEQ